MSPVADDAELIGSEAPGFGSTASRRRLGLHYVILVVLLVSILITAISLGGGIHPAPNIAGGYDVSAGVLCLGSQFDVEQSGQYVDLSNAQSTLSGTLLLKHAVLTGEVGCLHGGERPIHARAGARTLAGTIGGLPLAALLTRDPPPPGAPKPLAPGSVDGTYALAPTSACLGGSIVLTGPGSAVRVSSGGAARGTLVYRGGNLAGAVGCEHGAGRWIVAGTAAGLVLDLMLKPIAPAPATAAEHVSAAKQRTPDQTVLAFFLAIFVVMLFARLCGSLMPRIGQPRVMGEVLAGILLGPTFFGAIDPGLQTKIFAADIIPYINVAANLGLIFYMFLIGMEVDLGLLRGRLRMTFAISNTALALPLMLGLLAAVPLYGLLGPGQTKFLAFALFVAVSMSITAFPVLARIVSERRMLKRPLGALAVSAAAVDDVSAWFLIALATAVAGAGTFLGVLSTVGLAIVFCLAMGLLVRPLLARAAVAYDELGRVPGTWITAIFAGVLLSAITTDKIGIAVIFGGFVMGVVMPRHAGLSEEVTHRVEDFVLILLLPLFFAYTGLRTDVGLLNRGVLILIMLGLIAIAVLGKYGGTLIAARVLRLPWRESAALGVLMNTRGLTELIVLNLALTLGVISSALFAALVVMALVTTFMAGPMLRLIDPRNEFGAPPEAELAAAVPERPAGIAPVGGAILVAPQNASALDQLLALAVPLARSDPPREIIIARLVRPPRGSAIRGGLQSEARRLREAEEQVERARARLLDDGIPTRGVTLTSADSDEDLARLAQSEEVGLVLIDGRRPLLGDGVPREGVGAVLRDAPCDVAVLVARQRARVSPDADGIVMVPFGGADHDWAALEMAAATAASTGARLKLLGAAATTEGAPDASRLLANAAVLVRQYAGIRAEPVLAEPGREGILSVASEAELLFIGLSDRWRQEGLGETRRAIARAAPAPIVFVRRGARGGELEPVTEMTRYGWSRAGTGSGPGSGLEQ
jgi:Kef-type K+ transport system membrane component KefB